MNQHKEKVQHAYSTSLKFEGRKFKNTFRQSLQENQASTQRTGKNVNEMIKSNDLTNEQGFSDKNAENFSDCANASDVVANFHVRSSE